MAHSGNELTVEAVVMEEQLRIVQTVETEEAVEAECSWEQPDDEDDPDNQEEEHDTNTNTNGPPEKQTLLRPSSPNRPTAITITASTRTTTTTTTQPTPNRSSTSTSKSHCTPLGPSSSSATATAHKPTPPTVSTSASSPLEQQSSSPETPTLTGLDNSLLQPHYDTNTPPTTPPRQAPQVPLSPHLRQFNLVPQDAREDNVVAQNDPCCGAACLGYGTSSNSKNNKNKNDPNTDTPALVASWKTPTTTPDRSLPPQSPPSDDTGAPTTRTVVSTTKSLPSTPQKSLWQTARSSPTSPILGSRPRQSRSSPSSPATTNKASTNQETTPPNDDPHVIRLPISLLERASLQHSDHTTLPEATAALKEVARRLSQHEQVHGRAAQSSPAPQQQGHETMDAPQQLPPADHSTPDCCSYATVLEEPQPAAPVWTTTTNSTQGLSPQRPDPKVEPHDETEQPEPQPEALTAMEQLLDCMAEWTHEDTTQDDDTEQEYDWTLHHKKLVQLTQPDPPSNNGLQPPPDPPMSDNIPQQQDDEDQDEDLTAYFNEETIRHHQQEAAALQEHPHHPDFDSDNDMEPSRRTPSKPSLSSWQSNPPLMAASPGSLPPVWEGEGPEDEEEEQDTRDNNEEALIPLSPQEQEHAQALEALLQQANHHDDEQEMPLSVSAPILTSHTTFHGFFFTHVLQEDDDEDDDENETSSSSSFPTTNGSDSDMILLDDDMEDDEDNHSSTSSSTHFSFPQVLDGSSSTPNTRSTSVVQEHTQVVVTQPWVIPQEPDDEEASCSLAQDEEDDTHSMEAQPDWSRPDQQPPPRQAAAVDMMGQEKKSTVDGDAVSTTTATTVASTAVASSILDQLGRDGGSTPSPLRTAVTTTTTTTQTLDLDRMGTEEKKEDDRPVSGQCSSPQEKKKTEEEHEPTTVLTNGVVLPIKDQLTQPNGSSGAMGVMSEVVQHWQSMVGSPPTNESTTNGSIMKAEKDENPSALEVNPSVTEETQCTPPRTKPTLTLSTPEQDVLSSSPDDDLKFIPLTNTTPPRSSSKSVTSGAFSEESFTLATNFVTTPQRPVVEAEVDGVLEDVAKDSASPPRVVKAHEYPAEDEDDEKDGVDNDDDEAKGHSRTSSMQTEYNSSKAPTTNDGMVEDIQQMGETMFVASSPPSSPMSAKRQEALEESNNRKGEDDESDVYTSSSSEDDSTLTQAGSMSSSETLSSTSSAGQTTAAAALGANSSLLCPVKEGEEEEDEADELLFSSLSNSSLDKASEHELVQPSVVDRRMNSLVRQEHLNAKDLKVVVIQALVRGYLVRIQKPVDTETLQHEGAQDERRKSKLGRFVPKSLKHMRPRSPKSRRESKEVTPDKSPRSTSPGGRQRRLGSLVRRSAGGLFRRSHVWVSSNSLSPKREKSVENTKSLEPRQEVDHTNGESETEVDVKIEEESNAFALDKDSKATRLQAFVRLHLVQSMVRRQKRAAVLIQKCWRQHVLMQRIAAAKTICRVMSLHHRRRLADLERQRKEQDAVRVLQQAWRRHLSAKNRRENAAAETLQRAFSLYHEKCTMERRQNRAALTIQRVLAAFRTRRGQEKRCEHAALVIQRTFS